jgi:hypothetical protein
MNIHRDGVEGREVGKFVLFVVAVFLVGIMFGARPAHAASIVQPAVPAPLVVTFPDSFPFGYGGGPSAHVIPSTVQNLLGNLRAKIRTEIQSIFSSFF